MRISKLVVSEPNCSLLLDSTFVFPFGTKTLISSEKNSVGKTTLIRFLLFSMGYKIPSTHGIKMSRYFVDLYFDKGNEAFILKRHGDLCDLCNQYGGTLKRYNLSLPDEVFSLQAFLFGVENPTVLSNLLGCFYIDQDFGWRVAARGPVTQYNYFSCTSLISGLYNNEEKDRLDNDIKDLRLRISRYNALKAALDLAPVSDGLVFEKRGNDKIKSMGFVQLLLDKRNNLLRKICHYEKVLDDNRKLADLITQMNIVISVPGSQGRFPLKRDMLVDYDVNQNLIEVELADLRAQVASINKELRTEKKETNVSLELSDIKSISDQAYQSLLKSGIKPSQLEAISRDAKAELGKKDARLKELLTSCADSSLELQKFISDELAKFGKGDVWKKSSNLLTASIGARFSGIELHDISFAYTMGTYRFIKKLGIEVPLIIDSPGSGERVPKNLKELVERVVSDFGDSQLVVATAQGVDKDKFDQLVSIRGMVFQGEYELEPKGFH